MTKPQKTELERQWIDLFKQNEIQADQNQIRKILRKIIRYGWLDHVVIDTDIRMNREFVSVSFTTTTPMDVGILEEIKLLKSNNKKY
ncbi:MAG: hypothetical protein Q8O88_01155 [bacterium]|nr:hypothetical protein [bacterium]